MVPITSLVVPIVLSAVLVFLASSVIHMALGYHRADYQRVPKEDEVQEALRRFALPPADYMVPAPPPGLGARDPGFVEKYKKGPVMIMTVMPPAPGGTPAMGAQLVQWFVYCLVVALIAAYVAGRALAPGAPYLEAFRFAGTTAFVGYAMALPQYSIWYKRSWGTTLRSMFDGLVYGLLNGGAFGWLWP
jgi:hypothetical protein